MRSQTSPELEQLERLQRAARDAGVGSGEAGPARCERCGTTLAPARRARGHVLCPVCAGGSAQRR